MWIATSAACTEPNKSHGRAIPWDYRVPLSTLVPFDPPPIGSRLTQNWPPATKAELQESRLPAQYAREPLNSISPTTTPAPPCDAQQR